MHYRIVSFPKPLISGEHGIGWREYGAEKDRQAERQAADEKEPLGAAHAVSGNSVISTRRFCARPDGV